MITNSNPTEWLRAMRSIEADDGASIAGGSDFRRDQQPGIPGAIVAEFNESTDAVLFMRLKGSNDYAVTAGVSHAWAVRKRYFSAPHPSRAMP